MTDQPEIELTHERAFCSIHGEPLAPQWPKGYPTYVVKGWEKLYNKESFVKDSGGTIPGIMKALDKKPLCCRLELKELVQLYLECDIGDMDTCYRCGSIDWGTLYRVEEDKREHICFICVAERRP